MILLFWGYWLCSWPVRYYLSLILATHVKFPRMLFFENESWGTLPWSHWLMFIKFLLKSLHLINEKFSLKYISWQRFVNRGSIPIYSFTCNSIIPSNRSEGFDFDNFFSGTQETVNAHACKLFRDHREIGRESWNVTGIKFDRFPLQ